MPQHVAIIMDGNRRWAAKRGMPRARETRAHASVEMQDARLERSASAAFEISHDAASPFSAPSRARNVCTARE